jgi:hypothetical protein
MSVRATERIIGDLVIVTDLPNSPKMVVKSIDAEAKLITAAWFSNQNEYQEGSFPAAALDRAELKKSPPKAKTAKSPKAKPKRT